MNKSLAECLKWFPRRGREKKSETKWLRSERKDFEGKSNAGLPDKSHKSYAETDSAWLMTRFRHDMVSLTRRISFDKASFTMATHLPFRPSRNVDLRNERCNSSESEIVAQQQQQTLLQFNISFLSVCWRKSFDDNIIPNARVCSRKEYSNNIFPLYHVSPLSVPALKQRRSFASFFIVLLYSAY